MKKQFQFMMCKNVSFCFNRGCKKHKTLKETLLIMMSNEENNELIDENTMLSYCIYG